MNLYPILFFMIVDGEVESKRDDSDFEEEIKDRISVLRRCGQILETELITKDGLNDCMSRTILHRAKRSLKCYACQKTSLFITKEVRFIYKNPIKIENKNFICEFRHWNIIFKIGKFYLSILVQFNHAALSILVNAMVTAEAPISSK